MRFSSFFCFILIFITLSTSSAYAAFVFVDENRIISSNKKKYLDNIYYDLKKTNIEFSVILLENNSLKINYPLKDNSIQLYVNFDKRFTQLLLGNQIKKVLQESEISELKQKYLFPYFKTEKYESGVILFSYFLAKKISQKKGFSLSVQSPSLESNSSLNIASFIFLFFVFLFLFLSIKKHLKDKQNSNEIERFKYKPFS